LSRQSTAGYQTTKNLFELDETIGKEYFYLFASPQPIAEFEGKGSLNLNKTDIDDIIEIKKMGVAGIKAKRNTEQVNVPKYTKELAEVKNKLQAEGVFVTKHGSGINKPSA